MANVNKKKLRRSSIIESKKKAYFWEVKAKELSKIIDIFLVHASSLKCIFQLENDLKKKN